MGRHCRMQLVTFLLYVLLNVGSGQTLQLDERLTPEDLCQTLTRNPTLRNALEETKGKAVACPCTQSIIKTDLSFEHKNSCYTQYFFTDGVKQMCCYDYYGNLVKTEEHGGYIIDELFEHDIAAARRACCVETNNCEAFYSLNPPDDCSRYRQPYSVRSWGDPHITTLDKHTYSFNGHGEYLFVQLNDSEGEVQIQARTEYQTEGVVDATIFVAFVVHVQNGNDSDLISVFLNKTSGLSVYNSSGAPISVQNQLTTLKSCSIIYIKSDVISIKVNVPYLTIKISSSVGLGLDITLTPAPALKGIGLAGSVVEGSFVGRNGTEFNINSTEADLFPYGESWSLKANESKFNYSLTGGSFKQYNTNHTTPRFLEQLTGNLTALFEGWNTGNITLFNATCFMEWKNEVSTDCLLAIARSRNVGLGNATMNDLRNQYNIMRQLNNKPPKFTDDMITHLKVNYSDTEPLIIDLSKYVTDPNNDTLTFEVSTNIINTTTYSIDPNTGLFSWLVDDQGRSDDLKLTFIVRDEYNVTVPKVVSISYCGCEKSNYCAFDFTDPKDTSTFERSECSCTGRYSSGRFCESRINPCEITNCTYAGFNITCDENSEDDNPCGDCPDGYQESFSLRQQICEDIDECNDQGWCEQSCENLVGSFECDCYKGFSLNSTNKRTCIDIDECAEGSKTCSDNELCSDPRGNATCVCKAGYSRKEGGPCEKIKGFSYTFTMSLQLSGDIKPETLETEDFKNQTKQELLRTLKDKIHLIDIIIRRIYFEAQQNTQRKKRASQSRKMHIDYAVVTKNQTTYKDLGGNMTAALSTANITINKAIVSFPENFTVESPPEGSCTLGNSCDGQTAKCVDKNGNITCECMDGFKRTNTSSSYCIDIDECMQNDTPSRCYGGTCINLYGGWNCSCPVNTSWAKVGEDSYPYHYRCQGNHRYIGNMSLYRAEQEIKTDNETTTYIQDLFKLWIKNETVNEGDTPLTDLYLSTTIFNFKTTQNIFSGTHYGYLYNFSFILSLGESVNISRIDSVFQAAKSMGIRPNNTCKNVINDCKIFNMIFYEDTDEILCHLGNDCDPLSTKCAVSGGKYHCQCKTGFEAYDDLSCRDIDECYADDFSCPGNSTCINHIGNWTCACPDGYTTTYEDYHNITCTDVDECSDNTTYGCLQGKCNNTDGGWECVCAPGFISNKLTENVYTCKDVDECLGSEYNCHNNGTCINLQNGTWTCTCPAGYKAETINDKNINCTDIDECADNTTYFCQNGTCSNTEGSWDCGCDTGFRSQWNKKHNYSCIDIDECEEGKCNGNCINTHGSFNCDCQDGFKRSNGTNGSIVCTDIDECSLTDTYNCSGGPCVNDIGGWGCQCDKGYTPRKLSNTTIECHDVNECDDIICLESSCINTNGSFYCNCSEGYEMDNVTDNVYQCKDIKECSQEDSEYHCLNGGHCQELQGNWTCNCPVGYATEFLNRTHIDCKDIDECSLDSCKHGQCSNHPGNWTCECNPGFKFKSKTNTAVICEDIDECANNTCDGECVNLSGNWSCSCPAGFNNISKSASHIVCQDINECENGSGFHCKNAMGCINTNGSWTCNCRDGERLQTVNQSTKICEAGKTYSFQREVTIVTTNPLLQSNRTVLENVLRKKIKTIFLRVFPDGEFSVGVDALKEVSDKLNTYAAFFWARAYSVKPREVIVADWNSSYKQECDRAICIENQETTVFQIIFTEETDTTGFSSDLCSIEGANTCNPASTDCSMKDGEIKCLCKDGYEKNPESSTSCKDVDECDISGQCTRGSCLNTVGAFTCKCPAGLDNPVKNSTNITVCSGSNKYTQVTELSVSRELNQSEKADLVKKLEEKIRQTYEEDLKGVTVTVVVTISYIEPTTPTRRKRADQVKTSFGYTLKSTIYANVSDQENELEDVLKRVVTKKKIDDITEANITSVSDPKWNKATTTTASTTKDVTPILPCTKTCEDGCKCVSGSGEQQCICPTTTTQSVKVEPKSDSELQDLKTLLFGTAGGLGFLILILVVVIILVCRRYSKQQKRKSRKGEHIQLGPMGAGSTGEVYIGQEFTSTDVDKLSMGTTYSNRFRPGQLPSIQGLPEPRPDYDPPPIYAKPDIHRSVPMNPLYGRSGSPTPDYRDGRLPRTSDSSHDSGMEVSRGSLNFDRRRREPNNRRVHSLYNQSNQM